MNVATAKSKKRQKKVGISHAPFNFNCRPSTMKTGLQGFCGTEIVFQKTTLYARRNLACKLKKVPVKTILAQL
jgi:hypothetical protein